MTMHVIQTEPLDIYSDEMPHYLALQEEEMRKICATPVSSMLLMYLNQVFTTKPTTEHISHIVRSKSCDDIHTLHSTISQPALSCTCTNCTSLVKCFKKSSTHQISDESVSLLKSSSCIRLESPMSLSQSNSLDTTKSGISSSNSSHNVESSFITQPQLYSEVQDGENYEATDDTMMSIDESSSESASSLASTDSVPSKVSSSSSLNVKYLPTTPPELKDLKNCKTLNEDASAEDESDSSNDDDVDYFEISQDTFRLAVTLGMTVREIKSYSSLFKLNDVMNSRLEHLNQEEEERTRQIAAAAMGSGGDCQTVNDHALPIARVKIHSKVPMRAAAKKIEKDLSISKENKDKCDYVCEKSNNYSKMDKFSNDSINKTVVKHSFLQNTLGETGKLMQKEATVIEESIAREPEIHFLTLQQRLRNLIGSAGKTIRHCFKRTFCCCT